VAAIERAGISSSVASPARALVAQTVSDSRAGNHQRVQAKQTMLTMTTESKRSEAFAEFRSSDLFMPTTPLHARASLLSARQSG
jgi:hypothetical protein